MSINYFNFNKEEKSMKENEKLRLEEDVRENANSQEEKTTTEEGKKDQTEVAEEKEVNEPNSEEKKKEGEEGENEEKENSSTRKILIFSIVGVVAVALVIVLCIVFANSARKEKQEEVINQQTAIEEEAEEQTTTIEEVAEVEAESTPEPTAEPKTEPTPEPTSEPVEMVSWEEWASQPGEEEPHLVVWNEEEGKQLIIEPDSTYTMEDGDKLAVSASMSIENLNEMSAVVIIKEGDFTKQNIVTTDYGQYWEIDIQKEGKNKIDYDFKGEEYGYIVVK